MKDPEKIKRQQKRKEEMENNASGQGNNEGGLKVYKVLGGGGFVKFAIFTRVLLHLLRLCQIFKTPTIDFGDVYILTSPLPESYFFLLMVIFFFSVDCWMNDMQ